MARVRNPGRFGFTLVEAVVGIALATALMVFSYRVFTYIGMQRSRGAVDLQELQGARYAINYLRRDFRSAAPQIANTATLIQKKKALRMPMVEAHSFTIGNEAVPVIIDDAEIYFYKHLYSTPDSAREPSTEQVNYRIDGARKCLVRSVAGVEIVFKDIKAAKFELYAHPLAPEVPMLLVTLRIDADQKDIKAGGREYFELTTTISSAITSQILNNPFWHISQD
ncbi:MAG: hypothetical protein KKB51_06650 [Candidatus Riflebacteria bacterium]|nr:hypothetical protein [Candidatus Riflebacteria bacterium]